MQKRDKAMVVIGKMGSGKSSFVKMFLNDEQSKEIKIKGGKQSVTHESKAYKINPNKFKTNDQLYIIDTPGLDSQQSVILVLQGLDQCIRQRQYEIIALIYVLDINNIRDKKIHGKDALFFFYENFKLRHSIKKQIFFCVLSKFDKYYLFQEQNEDKYQQFMEEFNKNGLGQSWKKKIQWISEPQKSAEIFHKIINPKKGHEAYPIYKKQWQKLKQNIQSVIANKKYLPWNAYIADINGFDKLIAQQLENITANSKQMALQQISYQVKIFDVMTLHLSVIIISGIILPYMGPGWYALYKIVNSILKEQQNNQSYIKITNQKNALIKAKILSFQIKKIKQGIKITYGQFKIKKSQWINKIKSTIVKQTSENLTIQQKEKKYIINIADSKYGEKTLIITFEIKTPTIKEYEKILLQYSSIYFGKK